MKDVKYPSSATAATAVVGHDEHGDDGVDPAAEVEGQALAKGMERAHGAFLGHAPQGGLGHDEDIAECDDQDQVDEQEDPAAVFGRQVGEAPDVPQPYRRTGHGQDISDPAGKGPASCPVLGRVVRW